MALYLIGDIQGCYSELKALLKQVNFDKEKDQLWAAGDIVARGDDSLATIEYLQSLGDSFNMVLGNHDLHLMSIFYGLRKAKKSDKLENLITSKQFADIIEWLAKFPLLLALPDGKSYLSHAGLTPQWSIEQAIENAHSAEQKIRSPQRKKWLAQMYGNTPNDWQHVKTDIDKFRYTINAFTRMRFCFPNGSLEFNSKSSPDYASAELSPWFDTPRVQEIPHITCFFGHWAALMGETNKNNMIALDTGCVWGQHLTLYQYNTNTLYTEQSHSS